MHKLRAVNADTAAPAERPAGPGSLALGGVTVRGGHAGRRGGSRWRVCVCPSVAAQVVNGGLFVLPRPSLIDDAQPLAHCSLSLSLSLSLSHSLSIHLSLSILLRGSRPPSLLSIFLYILLSSLLPLSSIHPHPLSRRACRSALLLAILNATPGDFGKLHRSELLPLA